jgi:hypothetical protein
LFTQGEPSKMQQEIQTTKSNNGSIVPVVIVVGIVLIGVMSVMGNPMVSSKANYLFYGNGASSGNQAPASGASIVGGPTISAQKIDAILANAGSPAAGSGQALHDLSAQYNIDDAFSLAVFKHESNYGKYGVAANSLSLGNLRCIPGAACVGGYAYFNSWQEGYEAFYKLISGPLYVGAGLTTPNQIMPRYAPSGDSNDPVGYASDVDATVATWRQS